MRIIASGLGLLFVMSLLVALIYVSGSKISSVYESEVDMYEEHVGSNIYLNGDTLIIVDYSVFNETFTLSNGSKVSFSFVTKNPKP